MSVKFNGKYLANFIKESEYTAIWPQVELAHKMLEERSGMGFTIMESFMDTLRVTSREGQGTKVTMRRRIAQRAARR